MRDVILTRYAQGSVLVGISAGAVQLGRYGMVESPESPTTELLDVFNLVPMVIDAHDERANWARLCRTIQSLKGAATGLGIPSGGGIVVRADGTIQPLRRPAHEFRFDGTSVTHSRLHGRTGQLTRPEKFVRQGNRELRRSNRRRLPVPAQLRGSQPCRDRRW